jgi:hypothetical protein
VQFKLFKLDNLETQRHEIEIDREKIEFIYRVSPRTAQKLDRICHAAELNGKESRIVLSLPKWFGYTVAERIALEESSEDERRKQTANLFRLIAKAKRKLNLTTEEAREALGDPYGNIEKFGEYAAELADARMSAVTLEKKRATVLLKSRILSSMAIDQKVLYQQAFPEIWTEEDTEAFSPRLLEEIMIYLEREEEGWKADNTTLLMAASDEGEISTTLRVVQEISNEPNESIGTKSISTSSIGESSQDDTDAIVLEVV